MNVIKIYKQIYRTTNKMQYMKVDKSMVNVDQRFHVIQNPHGLSLGSNFKSEHATSSVQHIHSNWSEYLNLKIQTESKIGFSSQEIVGCFPFLEKMNIFPCVFSIGCHFFEKFLDFNQQESLKTMTKLYMSGKFGDYSDNELLAQLFFHIKKTVETEMLQQFGLSSESDLAKCFISCLNQNSRAQVREEFKRFQIDLTELDGLFCLETAIIYVFIKLSGKKIATFSKIQKRKIPKAQIITQGTEKSIEEILKDIEGTSKKTVSKCKKVCKKKKIVGKSVPRILKIQQTKRPIKTDEDDEVSVTMNKYNKRFTKTKKPGRV
jgi:hypothetical protein